MNLAIRQTVASSFPGILVAGWDSPTKAELQQCPGASFHTKNPGKVHLYLDGSPNVRCFNESCQPFLAELNARLQSEIGKAEFAEMHPGHTSWDGKNYTMHRNATVFTPGTVLPPAPVKPKNEDYQAGLWETVVESLIVSKLPNLHMTPATMTAEFLRRNYLPDEWVQIATNIDGGHTYSVSALLAELDDGTPFSKIQLGFGENCWIRVNPVRKGTTCQGGDADVTAHRNGLVEFDRIKKNQADKGVAVPLQQQWAFIQYLKQSGLPVKCTSWSGAKSLQCIVRVEAGNPADYTAALKAAYAKIGGPVDRGMYNPSRYCRLPGCFRTIRDEAGKLLSRKMQTLLEVTHI